MAITTYAELKAALDTWSDSNDVATEVDTLIDLAEARHKREIRIRDMLTRDAAFTIDSRYESLPADFLEGKLLRIMLSEVTIPLQQITEAQMNQLRREIEGTPRYFTVHSDMEFDLIPYTTFTAEFIYYAPLTALSDSNTSNALLTRAPECYLWAAMSAAATLEWEDERLNTWETLYTNARDELNRLDQKPVGVPISRVVGLTP
jgi:hypothetical protein